MPKNSTTKQQHTDTHLHTNPTHTHGTPSLYVCVCNLNFCVVNGAGRRSRFATSFCVYYCVLDSSLSLSSHSFSLSHSPFPPLSVQLYISISSIKYSRIKPKHPHQRSSRSCRMATKCRRKGVCVGGGRPVRWMGVCTVSWSCLSLPTSSCCS